MATGSVMMGTLKGKLGETVLLRRSGKQVIRAYVRDVKNPNSQKQQVQRMVQSTVAQAYSAMKKICDHSFEGVQVGQKSMSYFMSKNMDKLRASIVAGTDGTLVSASADFVRKGVNLPVLNKYIVGKGTLPAVSIVDSVDAEYSEFDSKLQIAFSNAEGESLSVVAQKFIDANSGIEGDWFTLLLLFRENGAVQSGQNVYRFGFVRFVVELHQDPGGGHLVLQPSLTSVGVPSVPFENAFGRLDSAGDQKKGLSLQVNRLFSNIGTEDGQLTPCAYAVIHSRQNVGGSWQRSNAEFVIRDNWEALNITWPDDFFAELATYAGSAEAKGQGDYVLNGGQ